MSNYLIGFDIGTLSSKAVLTDLKGNIIAKFQKNIVYKLSMQDGKKKV